VLDEKGSPTVVERALIYPPQSRLIPLTPEERSRIIQGSVLYGHYEKVVDRESAFEKLKVRAEEKQAQAEAAAPARGRGAPPKSQTEIIVGAVAKSAAHAIGSQIGRQIIRGVLGSIFGSGRKR
jgi:DNA helicase HerA-like ATPase